MTMSKYVIEIQNCLQLVLATYLLTSFNVSPGVRRRPVHQKDALEVDKGLGKMSKPKSEPRDWDPAPEFLT